MKYNRCTSRANYYFMQYTGDNSDEFIEFLGPVAVGIKLDTETKIIHLTYYNEVDYEDTDVIVYPDMYAVKRDLNGRVKFYSERAFEFNFEVTE